MSYVSPFLAAERRKSCSSDIVFILPLGYGAAPINLQIEKTFGLRTGGMSGHSLERAVLEPKNPGQGRKVRQELPPSFLEAASLIETRTEASLRRRVPTCHLFGQGR
jgi:hypothetical protein